MTPRSLEAEGLQQADRQFSGEEGFLQRQENLSQSSTPPFPHLSHTEGGLGLYLENIQFKHLTGK